uniref:Uncharacterized protein n=1 Tax=Mesocestoides corti TaxID=53468 RepID=A0A5K3FU10_MESCO
MAQTYWTTWPQPILCLSVTQWHAGEEAGQPEDTNEEQYTSKQNTRLYGLRPIRIAKFVLHFDAETNSTGHLVISNSAPHSEGTASFPTSTEYRDSSDIFKWLKIYIDTYC